MILGSAETSPGTDLPPPWVIVVGRRPPEAGDRRATRVGSAAAGAQSLWLLAEDGRRPDVAETRSLAAMFAGRLDDRDALRSDLDSPPVENTDAALVLRAYLNGGESALRQLRGAFVVLVLDRHSGQLLVLRDPLGYYPLFFAAAADRLLLSPSLDELLCHKGVSKDVDRATAAAWVM